MLFVRRQFEMHKRNSHIIRGTLNSTVTRVPSPFPHPVASVYLFLSLSPSFCLSVCLSLFSTQRRPLERATKELLPLWCETALELEAHVQRLAYIIFQLAFPHFPSPPDTHTHAGTFEKRWQAFVPSCCEDEKSCSSYYSNAFQQLPHRNPFLIFHGGRPCPASLLSLKVSANKKPTEGGAGRGNTLSHTPTPTHTYTMHMHIAEGSVEHI